MYRKHIKEPWLQMIKSGKKEYEGRIYRDDWAEMKPGDIIKLYNENEEYNVQVIGKVMARNFDELYDVLGSKLVPYIVTKENFMILEPNRNQVQEKYEQIFNMTKEEIAITGVVGIHIKPI